jgi:hypothetical protein
VRSLKFAALAALALSVLTAPANAANVGYFTDSNNGSNGPASVITGAGHTATKINDINLFDFSTVDMLFIDNASNSGLSAALTGRLGDINTWVSGGGGLIVHDRFVRPVDNVAGTGNPFLLGPGGSISLTRTFTNNIDVVPPPGNLVVNGYAGSLTNASLDGGNYSAHGWADLATLPVGGHEFLNFNGDPNKIVAFDYQVGGGWLYYSTIPLDFYLDGNGNNPPRDNLKNIYAPNVIGYMEDRVCKDMPGPSPVPEPMSMATMGLGLPLLGWMRRHKARKA